MKFLVIFFVLMLIFGCGFVGIKVIEYMVKFSYYLIFYWDFDFYVFEKYVVEMILVEFDKMKCGVEIFFGVYFMMIGLYVLYMLIGMGFIVWLLWYVVKGCYNCDYYNLIECFGFYWYFVDLVWIFFFLLFYLFGCNI